MKLSRAVKYHILQLVVLVRVFFSALKAHRCQRLYLKSKNGDLSNALAGKTIVINCARSLQYAAQIEYYLGYVCAQAGAAVFVLYDDGILEHWDSVQVTHSSSDVLSPYKVDRWTRWRHCVEFFILRHAHRTSGLSFIPYTSLDCSNTYKHGELDLKEDAKSSTIRYFTDICYDEMEADWYYQKSLRNSQISATVAEQAVVKYSPDLFITSHGIYSLWGPAYRKMLSKGVQTAVWSLNCYRDNGLFLVDRSVYQALDSLSWKQHRDKVLTVEQKKKAEDWLFARRGNVLTGSDSSLLYNSAHIKRKRHIARPSNGYIYGMFPNAVWDGHVKERDTLFCGLFDWIKSTIECFKDNPNKLIIRFHPSENKICKSARTLEELILTEIPEVLDMSNVEFVGAEEQINTYQLIQDYVDIGIVYSGTLALELPHMKKPVIAASESVFVSGDYALSPKSKTEYREFLQNPELCIREFKSNEDERIEIVLRIVHWLMNEATVDASIIGKPYSDGCVYEIKSNKNDNAIINRIIELVCGAS